MKSEEIVELICSQHQTLKEELANKDIVIHNLTKTIEELNKKNDEWSQKYAEQTAVLVSFTKNSIAEKENDNDWVYVNDGLPKENIRVFFLVKNDPMIYSGAYYDNCFHHICESNCYDCDSEIVAWRYQFNKDLPKEVAGITIASESCYANKPNK